MSEGNGYITKDLLLSATRRRYRDFVIPVDCGIEELAGKKIRLRSYTAKEKIAYEEFFIDPKTGQVSKEREDLNCEKLIIDTVVDGNDSPLFSMDDIRRISKIDRALVKAIADEAVLLNSITLQSSLEKKSEETTDSDSG